MNNSTNGIPDSVNFVAPQPNPSPVLPQNNHVHTYTTTDIVLAWLSWVIGYLLCVVIPVTECLWGAFAMEVILNMGALIFIGFKNRASLIRASVQAGINIAVSLAFLFSANEAIWAFAFLFTVVNWFYTVFVLSGQSDERYPGDRFIREAFRSVFVAPFRAPGNLFSVIFGGGQKPDGTPRKAGVGKTIGFAFIGLAVAVVPTVIVGLLLSYDQGFSDLMDKIFDMTEVGHIIHRTSVGICVGALMFGAVFGSLKQSLTKETENTGAVRSDAPHFLPVVATCAALLPLLLLYVIFFISQWSYYVSAFTGVLPDGLTYSEYARDGFFQLCAVVGINAGLAVMASYFTKRRPFDAEHPQKCRTSIILRIVLAVLSLFTLVLIATALSKMFLYVDTYGLTQKRVYASWLMFLLAVAFVAVHIKQAWSKMNLVGTLATTFAIFFIVITVVNVDTWIVDYNVDACLAGNTHTMTFVNDENDGYSLYDAGYAGVEPAIRFLNELNDAQADDMDNPSNIDFIRSQTTVYLQRMGSEIVNLSPMEKNITILKAEKALRDAGYIPKKIIHAL